MLGEAVDIVDGGHAAGGLVLCDPSGDQPLGDGSGRLTGIAPIGWPGGATARHPVGHGEADELPAANALAILKALSVRLRAKELIGAQAGQGREAFGA